MFRFGTEADRSLPRSEMGMPRFNIPIDRQYASLATPRIANERRVRRSVAMIGANDLGLRPSLTYGSFLKILTSVSMLTASAAAFLAWRLTQFPN